MNMTEIEADSHISLVKMCVKKHMFSYWKFNDRNNDFQYSSLDEGTMCGFIIKHTSIDPRKCNKDWWVEMRNTVLKTHNNLHNNAIKTMQMKFKGKNRQTEVLNCISKPTHSTRNFNPLNTSRRDGLEHKSSMASPLRCSDEAFLVTVSGKRWFAECNREKNKVRRQLRISLINPVHNIKLNEVLNEIADNFVTM